MQQWTGGGNMVIVINGQPLLARISLQKVQKAVVTFWLKFFQMSTNLSFGTGLFMAFGRQL